MCVMVLVHFMLLCYVVMIGSSIVNNVDDEEEKRKRRMSLVLKKVNKGGTCDFQKETINIEYTTRELGGEQSCQN